MIIVKTFVFNAFQENTYVLSDKTGQCVIVDAGCNSDSEYTQLFNYILSEKLKPLLLLQTHGHVDHVLGAVRVLKEYGIPIRAHKQELDLVAQAQAHGAVFGLKLEAVPVISEFLEEGVSVVFGTSELQIFHVPGHSRGSVALYSASDKLVITGDVLFKGSIGRTDLPGGDYDTLMNSIFTKLLNLPDDTMVFPGHGPSSTIGIEKRSNPFLIG